MPLVSIEPRPPLPARPTAEQTREAQKFLRNADEIYRQARTLSKQHQPKLGPYFEQYRETLKLLNFAAADTVKARNLDPAAQVTLKDDTGHFFECDADWMAGRLLHLEAVLSISANQPEATIRDGIACLQKFLNYRPYDADAYRLLATAYTRVYERQHALDAIKRAAELDPNDVDIRVAQDALTNPTIGTREPSDWHIELFLSFCPLLIPVGIVMLFTRLAPLGFILAAAGGILWWLRNRSDTNKIYANAINKSMGIGEPKRTL